MMTRDELQDALATAGIPGATITEVDGSLGFAVAFREYTITECGGCRITRSPSAPALDLRATLSAICTVIKDDLMNARRMASQWDDDVDRYAGILGVGA